MNSSELYDRIHEIATTPGKNDKTAMVAKLFSDDPGEIVTQLMEYTFNPFLTYGTRLADVELPTVPGDQCFDAETWRLLADLAERKLTGHNARDAISAELRRLDSKSAGLLTMIILKDLRAGFGENTVNKVCKGLIPTFPYMRCSLPKDVSLNEWPWQEGVISQEKADGMFTNVNVDAESVWLTTRQGTPLPYDGFADLHEEAKATFKVGTQTHGEILVVNASGQVLERKTGNGMLNKVVQGGAWEDGCYPVLRVWDQIPLLCVEPKGQYKTPYRDRLKDLIGQIREARSHAIDLVETRIVRSMKEALAHYREKLAEDKEGTIIKRPDMIWRDHTSKGQVKFKLTAPCELRVVGLTPGKGKNAKFFGALECESSCGLLKVNVGSGLTDKQRQEEDWLDAIITVKFNEIMYSDDLSKKAHSLFLPIFEERRLDKTEPDSFERIEAQMKAAVEAVG